MSSKPGKKEFEEKESPRGHAKVAPARPPGRIPMATVVARHGTGNVTREGKGFSLGELSDAKIIPRLASKWGVRLDGRRRSVLEVNVSSLKIWGTHAAKAERPEGEVKKVREELVKVEKEVKKEVKRGAAELKKEVAKVEAKAKRKPTKVEKKVKKKGEKAAKGRPKKKRRK